MADIFNFTDTWNDGLVTFFAIKCDVTDTASAAASKLLDLQVGGISKVSVSKYGLLKLPTDNTSSDGTGLLLGDGAPTDPLYANGLYFALNDHSPNPNFQASGSNQFLGPALYLSRSRGTAAVPAGVLNGDDIGFLYTAAHDGTNWMNPFYVEFVVSGAVSAAVVPTDMVFWGRGSLGGSVEVGRIRDDGTFVWAGQFATSAAAPTLTSGATIAPTAPISFVSGTTDIVNITAPAAFAAGGGQITLIPTGVWHTTTAGNIANVITAVVNVPVLAVYDHTTTKWYMK